MDVESKTVKKLCPPYLAFKTLKNFLETLRPGIPSRIDRSLMGTYSGTVQGQLLNTLQFLGLISADGIPSDRLNSLVHSEGPEQQKNLSNILAERYPYLFEDGFDLQNATATHLLEQFAKFEATGDTLRKALTFFLAAAKEAGIRISPHVRQSSGPKRGSSRTRKPKTTPQQTPAPVPGESEASKTHQLGWKQLLLSKLPSFDPSWDDEAKKSWLDAYREVARILDGN